MNPFFVPFRIFQSASLAFLCLITCPSRAADPPLRSTVLERVGTLYPRLETLYRELHANPELSLHEEKTAATIAAQLRNSGFTVQEKIGGHGIAGVLTNGPGPVVLVRTDLDALPVIEQTGAPYSSKVRVLDDKKETVAVMHACGHDIHMTVFSGVAALLSSLRDSWKGTLVFIGQPAEEKGKGARAMLNDGLFTRVPKPAYCLALHCSAVIEAGKVGYIEGHAMANVDSVNVTIRGIGGHGAWPHTTKDPIVLAAQTVLALQTIVSRETAPIDPAVVTVGSIHGGTKHNIIPEEVRLQLTLRSYSDDVRTHNLAAVERIARGLAQAAGLPETRYPTVELEESTPALYNDPPLARRLANVFQTWLGNAQVVADKPVMGGEDFSEYGRTPDKIPVCLFWVGAVPSDKWEAHERNGTPLPSLHSSQFLPATEPTIKTGLTAMTAAILELLRSPNPR